MLIILVFKYICKIILANTNKALEPLMEEITMEQLSFFGEAGQSKGLPQDFLTYKPGLLDVSESDQLLQKFITDTPWKQTVQKMYDKEVITPRLTAWYGDFGTNYSSTGKVSDPIPWTKDLLYLKQLVEPIAGVKFNSVLLNYYRDGNDSVAWHSDRESVLGKNPVIASVSFGQVRSFDIRNKQDHSEKYSVRLEHGSFLLMKAGLQEHWEHRIAKSTKGMKARVNLTFRVVL
jgi:alkylated DNA repair dioxygenase AlkB